MRCRFCYCQCSGTRCQEEGRYVGCCWRQVIFQAEWHCRRVVGNNRCQWRVFFCLWYFQDSECISIRRSRPRSCEISVSIIYWLLYQCWQLMGRPRQVEPRKYPRPLGDACRGRILLYVLHGCRIRQSSWGWCQEWQTWTFPVPPLQGPC